MRFKCNKTHLLNEIRSQVNQRCYVNLQAINPSSLVHTMESAIQECIKGTVNAGFEALINNIYTEEEFEDDIGLR